MNTLIETLNLWGKHAADFAWPMLWQSSLLAGIVFALDWLLRGKLRPDLRYALWMLVLIKLLLPPSLALPTGPRWWLRPTPPAKPPAALVLVSYGPVRGARVSAPEATMPPAAPAAQRLSTQANGLLVSVAVSLGLLGWLLHRCGQVSREAREAAPAPECLRRLFAELSARTGRRRRVQLKLTSAALSPALYGLFQPTIVLPRTLFERLGPAQLRGILLHELVHLRRGDSWVNCLQTLLQIAYWWHPLLWLANARLRRLREEAVDDAVMLGLREESDEYAPALLEVARLALRRPLTSLGLVGVLESRNSLKQRIQRLAEFRPPRRPGLTAGAVLCLLSFAAVALPMGEPPAQSLLSSSGANETVRASATSLISRLYMVDTRALRSGAAEEALRNYFKSLGVDLTPPKTLILNERAGALFVRASASEMELIGKGIDRLNGAFEPKLIASPATNAAAASGFVQLAESAPRRSNTLTTNPPAASVLVQDGKLLYEMGRLDEAESKLKQAIAEDPQNQAAYFYLNLVNERRYADVARASSNAVIPIVRAPNTLVVGTARAGSNAVAAAGAAGTNLLVRVFKVDPNTFLAGLTMSNRAGMQPVEIQPALKELFSRSIGVDLSWPKAIWFKDREGTLLVKATAEDLDAIEGAVHVLNMSPPQVHIAARFIALSKEQAADVLKSTKLAGILTDPQARFVMQMLERSENTDLLNEASVTTLSGRQAQISMWDHVAIATNINPQALLPPGITKVTNSEEELYQTWDIVSGLALDVFPVVAADGWTIHLDAMPSLPEFLGYDQPTNSFLVYVNNQPRLASTPRPHFHDSVITNSADIPDGQTLVLGGLSTQVPKGKRAQAGLAGAVPTDKRLFLDESGFDEKPVLVFITATIIDPAGNRVHSEDETKQGAPDARRK